MEVSEEVNSADRHSAGLLPDSNMEGGEAHANDGSGQLHLQCDRSSISDIQGHVCSHKKEARKR